MARGKDKDKEIKDVGELVEHFSKKFPPVKDRLIPTNSLVTNYLFGGGFPESRVISVYSSWGVGKTLWSVCVAKSILDENNENIVIYCDLERGLSSNLLKNVFGEDYEERYKNRFILLAPQSYDQTEEVIKRFMDTGKLKLVIVDSVTVTQTQAIDEEEVKGIATKAAAQTKFCERVKFLAPAGRFSVIYIAQERANINMTYANGPKTKMAVAKALPFDVDVIMKFTMIEAIKNDKDEKVAAAVKIMCEKNRLVGNLTATIFFRYGYGISNIMTVTSFLQWSGIVTNAGAYFTFRDEDFDFGDGVGNPVRCHGTAESEELIKSKLVEIMNHYQANGKLQEYFNSYVHK